MKRTKRFMLLLMGLCLLVLGNVISASAASLQMVKATKTGVVYVDNHNTNTVIASSGKTYNTDNIQMFDASMKAQATYVLKGKYTKFTADLLTSTESNQDGLYNLKFYADDKLIKDIFHYESSDGIKKINLNVKGVNKLRIESSNDGGWENGWVFFVNGVFSSGSVKLSDTKLTLSQKESTFVTSTYYNASGKETKAKMTWKSSNTKVAKVSSKGKIVAVAAGTCTITCKAADAVKTIKIIVKPTKVKKLAVLTKSKNKIQLQWSAVPGATHYQVYMYDTDLEEYTLVRTVKSSVRSARIEGLKKNTSYKFRVRAVLKAGSKKYYGDYSKTLKAKTAKK